VVPGETCDLDSAVTGVEFYGTGTYPDEYDGALFFTDYARRCIWAMLPDAGGVPDPGNVVNFVTDAQSAVDLEIGPGGDLFYVALAAGQIRRISYTGGPTAVAAASPTNGALPLLVNFDGTGSTAIVPGALTYAWDLDGDGQYDDSSEAQPSHTYTSAATIPVGLRVTDAGGATDTDSIDITAGNTAPTPVIDTPDAGTTWEVGEVISFSGHATDPDDGALPETSLSWSVILHHCGEGCHTHPIEDFAGVAGADFPAPDHEYPSYLELQLTATDLGGLSSTTSLALQPRSVELTFQSSPSGLQIAVGSEAATTPFTRTVIVGSSNSISATTPQSLSGTTYEFVSWSDGGAQSHDITAPSTSASYTATYVPVVTVNVTDFRFMPRRVNVANGTIVRWNFIGPSTHTVTSTLFNSGPIGPGGSFSYTVTSNRIRYSCTIHPTMTGNIKLI
jgi:PKD repeat protein